MAKPIITVIITLLLTTMVSQFGVTSPLSNIQQAAPSVTILHDGLRFVATIMLICQDPIEGYWLQCRTGESIVLIWESNVGGLMVGSKYEVLCTYHGYMPYQYGKVSVYIGILWEAME